MSRRNQRRKERQSGDTGVAAVPRHNPSFDHSIDDGQPRFVHEDSFADTEREEGSEPPSWRSLVAHHPILTLVAGFGVGVGFGVLGVAVLGTPRRGRWLDDHGRFHQISEALGDIPRRIADHLPENKLWR